MTKKTILTFILAALALAAASFGKAGTDPVVIKLASMAPEDSPWDRALHEAAAEWTRISGGAVTMKIYAGGIAGSESDMLRKLRIGIIDAAVFTNIGMSKVNPNLSVLNTPFLVDSKEEFDTVFDKMRPEFVGPIEKAGFKVLFADLGGWIYFFTKTKIQYPEDLKKFKISFATGEPEMEQAFKSMGYRVIPNDMKDLMMGLQSGMVDAFYLPALLAASGQYFALAPHMLPLRMSPLVGYAVVNLSAWSKVPEAYRADLQAAVDKAARGLYAKTQDLEKDAVKAMEENDLHVDAPPADALEKWRSVSVEAMDKVVGNAYPREIYDRVTALLRDFRRQHGT
jgi:TRAP-type C4-dicarboxylate transport system substrate-binding protein